ncbi:MAG: hypothetical protein ABW168_07355 [Sedimenticola sp.]
MSTGDNETSKSLSRSVEAAFTSLPGSKPNKYRSAELYRVVASKIKWFLQSFYSWCYIIISLIMAALGVSVSAIALYHIYCEFVKYTKCITEKVVEVGGEVVYQEVFGLKHILALLDALLISATIFYISYKMLDNAHRPKGDESKLVAIDTTVLQMVVITLAVVFLKKVLSDDDGVLTEGLGISFLVTAITAYMYVDHLIKSKVDHLLK